MERSAELEAVLRRFFERLGAGDADTAMSMWSREDEILWLGTDLPEVWTDWHETHAVMRAQMEEMPGGFPSTIHRIDAWSEGTVGWACADFSFEFEDPMRARYTGVWHLEGGSWKMVHGHTSFPASNVEVLGVELTTSMEAVAHAVQVDRPDLGVAAAPDGTVTLLFTDIEGSTERNQDLGDRGWMAVLRHHHELIRERVADHQGFEVKSMGDGFMIAFSSARRAVRCAADIQYAIAKTDELDVRVRAGLHAGEAVREGDDFYGTTVNMAARVAGSAAGGEVLVSPLVKALVDPCGEFDFDPPRATALKGIPGSHELYPLAL